MSNNLASGSSRPSTQPKYNDTTDDEDADVVFPLSSSFLNELQADDTTTVYTYFSTVSTNYTVSNLPGPGRLIGNFYSRAGKSLERRLGKIVNRAAIKEYGEAVVVLKSGSIYDMFDDDDPNEHEKACDVFLACARPDDVTVQLRAFETIVLIFISHPSKVRSAFRRVFERRNEISDVITFSWKRPGVEYSIKWLFHYKLASRCLSSHQSSFFEQMAPFDDGESLSLDFSHFEGLLLSCGETSDLLLSIWFIILYWNLEGVEDYIRSNGLKDLALVQFTNGLSAWWEAYFSEADPGVSSRSAFERGNTFLEGMARSIQSVGVDGLHGSSGYDTRLAIWAGAFKLHQFLRRAGFERYLRGRPIACKTWGELCQESLPNPEHAKLRRILLRLEDIYGSEMRKRFPPEKGSVIDLEETFLADAKRPITDLVSCTHCSNTQDYKPDLRRKFWRMPNWYDDRLRICDEMMIVIESTTIHRTTSAGVPYAIRIGQAAPNACNVCYFASLRRRQGQDKLSDLTPPPIVVIFTYHREILTYTILHVPAFDADYVLKSFEGGFRLHRKDIIHFTYEGQLVEEERDDE